MRFLALATDYDGTLATDGAVEQRTISALRRLRNSGRKLLLLTGRELPDLLKIFPHPTLFDRIVAENGAVLYRPSTREEIVLAESPPQQLLELLWPRKVPFTVCRAIVATHEPYQTDVLEAIRQLGLELQIIFNKGAVMVLPSSVNKASGLRIALEELALSAHNTVGIGDGENDHAFLSLCECSVAVAKAVDLLKQRSDLVMLQDAGDGVIELIDRIIASDLRELPLERHKILIGTTRGGEELKFVPDSEPVLVAGSSGAGKSTFARTILEQLAGHGYQFVVVDPEGDHEDLQDTTQIGSAKQPADVEQVTRLVGKPENNVVINLMAIPAEDRPQYFESLLLELQHLRTRTGRPHWIVIDEAHHLLPRSANFADVITSSDLKSMIFITVEPDKLSKLMTSAVRTVVVIAESPEQDLERIAKILGHTTPEMKIPDLDQREGLYWEIGAERGPVIFRILPPTSARRRHRRKYAQGELDEDRSFYFRGPKEKLNLRAQNLTIFNQLSEGVDDQTWLHHLKQGDYSHWFREQIKYKELADEAASIEQQRELSARESKDLIKSAVTRRYMTPL